ncbi:MAG: hypothetical protein GC153_07365 [Alphaproteobacteria bacterium]|nr:hypothetical protein [Alphaproteobacteria bacterium]
MPLEQISPPAEDAVSLDDMKAHLRVTDASEDAVIAACLAAATRAVEHRGGLALAARGFRLTLDEAPRSVLVLPKSPVFSLDAVEVLDRQGAATSVDAALYDFDSGAPGRLVARGLWPFSLRGLGAVRIDFTAGWTAAADIPEELTLAVKMLAAHFYENRESAGETQIFSTPQAVDALIAPWRSVRL